MRFSGRHVIVRVRRRQALIQRTAVGISSNHRRAAFIRAGKESLLRVQTQPSLARSRIRPMTMETILGQYRSNFLIEMHGALRSCMGECQQKADGEHLGGDHGAVSSRIPLTQAQSAPLADSRESAKLPVRESLPLSLQSPPAPSCAEPGAWGLAHRELFPHPKADSPLRVAG